MEMLTTTRLIAGSRAYRRFVKRDSVYKVATTLVDDNWGDAEEVTDAVAVLVLNWNQEFYRFARSGFDGLVGFLDCHFKDLGPLRGRTILTFDAAADEPIVTELFLGMLEALETSKGQSPVGAAKALHTLATGFFPIWDNKIAKAYRLPLYGTSRSLKKYLRFMDVAKKQLSGLSSRAKSEKALERKLLKERTRESGRVVSLLKLFDEYNYAKYTKRWIR